MRKLIYFKDGNGFIDIPNRVIGRWVWTDDQPYAQWKTDWVWCWTATELWGLNGDEWEVVFVLSTPNPHTRTPDKRAADDIFWKKKLGSKWHFMNNMKQELPKRKQEYSIRV